MSSKKHRKAAARKLAANRANAQKSTGPRTPESKAISKMNALKHGINNPANKPSSPKM